jgi:hypothetical protein
MMKEQKDKNRKKDGEEGPVDPSPLQVLSLRRYRCPTSVYSTKSFGVHTPCETLSLIPVCICRTAELRPELFSIRVVTS